MSEKVDIIFEGTLSRIGLSPKPPWPPGSVGGPLQGRLDAGENISRWGSADQVLFRAGGYRQGQGILYLDWVRMWVREVFGKIKSIKKGVTIPRNPLFLCGSGGWI